MASRTEQKQKARAERDQRAAEQSEREGRRRRLWQLGAAVVTAAALVVIAIVVGSAKEHKAAPPSLFSGIPQSGVVLGNPKAPVTMTEFADLQCPFCKRYTTDVLPTLVRDYVRTGKVKMVFRDIAFLGSDSVTAGRAATAAGQQNKLWQFIDVFYGKQQEENSGYVTDGFIRGVAQDVPALDVNRLMTARKSPSTMRDIAQARTQGHALKVQSTPSFFLQRGNGPQKALEFGDYTPGSFTGPIDSALGG
ncbi:MAG: DsbA family protein [Thermoleophilaceae bacterium]